MAPRGDGVATPEEDRTWATNTMPTNRMKNLAADAVANEAAEARVADPEPTAEMFAPQFWRC